MRLVQAIQFASLKHKGQERRGSGLPYVTHPIIVSHLIAKYKKDSKNLEDLQIAGLFHDLLEDTDTTYAEIERDFGPLVASIVQELTSDEIAIKEMGKNNYLKLKMVKMSKYAFIIKLIDRFSNITDGPTTKYILDTLDMMSYLRKNRNGVTKRQLSIIKDIERECKKLTSN